MQGKLKNDEDFGIDGRIQVILLKRNSNDFTISVCWTLERVLRVVQHPFERVIAKLSSSLAVSATARTLFALHA